MSDNVANEQPSYSYSINVILAMSMVQCQLFPKVDTPLRIHIKPKLEIYPKHTCVSLSVITW